MICVGAYQLPNDNAKPSVPQIHGTSFYFDTKVLLRFLGCAGESAVEATVELVNLIQTGGGKIYYYPQTLEEINNAFDKAIRRIERGLPPRNDEMRLYAAKIHNNVAILRTKRQVLRKNLPKPKSIFEIEVNIATQKEYGLASTVKTSNYL